jgi:hypothetical protein
MSHVRIVSPRFFCPQGKKIEQENPRKAAIEQENIRTGEQVKEKTTTGCAAPPAVT